MNRISKYGRYGTLSSVSIDSGNDSEEIFFLEMFALLATSELERRRVVLGGLLCVCLLMSVLLESTTSEIIRHLSEDNSHNVSYNYWRHLNILYCPELVVLYN